MTCGPPTEVEEENFDSPILRRLVETWDDYEHDELDEEDVLDVLDRIEDLAMEQVQSMEESAKLPDVDILDPNRIAIFQAFMDHLTALDKMRDFFREDRPGLIDEAFDIIQQATNRMMRGMDGLLTDADLPRKLCLQCQTPNLRDAKFCESCRAILPVIEKPVENRLLAIAGPEPEIDGSGKSTPNYIEMANAYDDWAYEEISPEDFFAIAKKIRKKYQDEYNRRLESLEMSRGAASEQYLVAKVRLIGEHIDVMDCLILSFERIDYQGVERAMHRLDQVTQELVELEELNLEKIRS